ncbi:MAG: outer membrane beta-barrel protein [Candidatus Omnitrophota bacterium]|nr:outer membrane beta-barrel protein [Candidatus Omnitrophota bacterium]
MYKKIFLIAVSIILAGTAFTNNYAHAQETWFKPFYYPYTAEDENWFHPLYHPYAPEKKGWFRPFLSIRGQYDDNIYLTPGDEREDWITTIKPGFVIEPVLTKHNFIFDYLAELNFFSEYDNENNYNHLANTALRLNFNGVSLELSNMFHYFSDRAGSEVTNRIPRTQDQASVMLTSEFNKLDLSLWYEYHLEDYRTNDPIGAYHGQALTFEDLDTDEHQVGVETALKLWPKSALLFSGDYGIIEHDTGRKSDSEYFDLLVGMRGQPTAKCTVEGKIGYRQQDYQNDTGFNSVVFNGSLIENFTPRDSLRLDFTRTTNETVMPDNPYYESSFIGAGFRHGFTEKFFGTLGFSYQRSDYPAEITVAGKTAKRKDDYWSGGAGFSYRFTEWVTADLKYDYRARESNFSIYNYENNRISLTLTTSF